MPCLLVVTMVAIDQYGYINPAFLGVPVVGKDQSGYGTLPSRGSPTGGQNQKWLHKSCLLGGQRKCLCVRC